MRDLAQSALPMVRVEVARNTTTEQTTLKELLADRDPVVATAAAANPSVDPDALVHWLDQPRLAAWQVRAAATNDACPKDRSDTALAMIESGAVPGDAHFDPFGWPRSTDPLGADVPWQQRQNGVGIDWMYSAAPSVRALLDGASASGSEIPKFDLLDTEWLACDVEPRVRMIVERLRPISRQAYASYKNDPDRAVQAAFERAELKAISAGVEFVGEPKPKPVTPAAPKYPVEHRSDWDIAKLGLRFLGVSLALVVSINSCQRLQQRGSALNDFNDAVGRIRSETALAELDSEKRRAAEAQRSLDRLEVDGASSAILDPVVSGPTGADPLAPVTQLSSDGTLVLLAAPPGVLLKEFNDLALGGAEPMTDSRIPSNSTIEPPGDHNAFWTADSKSLTVGFRIPASLDGVEAPMAVVVTKDVYGASVLDVETTVSTFQVLSGSAAVLTVDTGRILGAAKIEYPDGTVVGSSPGEAMVQIRCAFDGLNRTSDGGNSCNW